jgi:hypothetical protein
MKKGQRNGWIKSHKWVMVPHTVYEMRREMRVREGRQTVIIHPKRYYDTETGKFRLDKLESIKGYTLADIIDDTIHNNMTYGGYPECRWNDQPQEDYSRQYNIPKFVPKDNDWDEEIAKEEKQKTITILVPIKIIEPVRPVYPVHDYSAEREWAVKQNEIERVREKERRAREDAEERERQAQANTPKHFVYHPHHEAVIVSGSEYQHYLDNGWYDTPAKFPKLIIVR